MRCRAWIGSRFCKNNALVLFCHKHNDRKPYPAFLENLSHNLLQKITQHITKAETVQMVRSTCRSLHQRVGQKGWHSSLEFVYFFRLFSKQKVTVRQVLIAAPRFELLPQQQRSNVLALLSWSEIYNCKDFSRFVEKMRGFPVFWNEVFLLRLGSVGQNAKLTSQGLWRR